MMLTILYPYAQIRLHSIVFKKEKNKSARKGKSRQHRQHRQHHQVPALFRRSRSLRRSGVECRLDEKVKKILQCQTQVDTCQTTFDIRRNVKPGSTRKELFYDDVKILDTDVKKIGFASRLRQGYDEKMIDKFSILPAQPAAYPGRRRCRHRGGVDPDGTRRLPDVVMNLKSH